MRKTKPIILIAFIIFSVNRIHAQKSNLKISPNPCKDSTLISYNIYQADTVSLYVFNALGQIIDSILTKKFLDSGSYNATFNGVNFPNSVYLVMLKIGNLDKIMAKFIKDDRISTIEQIKKNSRNDILIFPNPIFDGFLTIKTDQLGATTNFQIFDNMGRLVNRIEFIALKGGECKIPVNDLSSGIYLLQIVSGGSQQSIKFIKQ